MDEEPEITSRPDPALDEEIPQAAPMGRNFFIVMALIGFLVFLILFINVPGMKASAGATLLQTTWILEDLADDSGMMVPAQNATTITAQFDSSGRVTGFSGCNHYSAKYTIKEYALSLQPPVITELSCVDPAIMHQESLYISDLVRIYEFRIRDSRLVMYDTTGKESLVFRPSNP